MRPTYPRSLFTFLLLALFALTSPIASAQKGQGRKRDAQESKKAPNCHLKSAAESKAEFKERTAAWGNKLERQLGRLGERNQAGQDKLEACIESLDQLNDFCNGEQINESKDCKAGGKNPVEGVESKDDGKTPSGELADQTIDRMVVGANCARARSACLKNGFGMPNRPSREKVEKLCGTDLDDEMKKIGQPQNDQDRQLYARLDQAKKIYFNIDKTLFEPQSTCNDDMANYYEGLAKDYLNVVNARNDLNRDKQKFTISCKERAGSFKTCEYTANGEKRIETIAEDGKLLKKVDDAPSALFGSGDTKMCSGECLSPDGNCGVILTAKHCGSMARALVIDKANQVQEVGVTSCDSASADWQLCRIDRSVNSNAQFLRTLDPTKGGDDCETSGFVKRCGPGAYQRLSQANPLPGMATGSGGGKTLLHRGEVFYDSSTQKIYHNFMVSKGNSGAGIRVRFPDGSTDIVAAHSWSAILDRQGYGDVVSYQDFMKVYKVQSIAPIQLSDGTPTMWRLAQSTEN